MTWRSFILKTWVGSFGLLTGLAALAQWQPKTVLDLSFRSERPSFPVAAYRHIPVREFRSMVVKGFESVGFSFVSIDEQKDKWTTIVFNITVESKMELRPSIRVVIDESSDRTKQCDPCFLRFTEIQGRDAIDALPWMTQYNLSALLVPAIDGAYSLIESSGREHLDPAVGFNYKRKWTGEKNLFGNSYAAVDLPGLRGKIVRAYLRAGFTPVDAKTAAKSSEFDLTFSFPIDPPNAGGVIYEVKVRGEYDPAGHCYPCEVTEQYDPYQDLPAAGFSGMLSRATLESRFAAARNVAYENMRVDLQRYLRPRSEFLVPPKPAALGSPRPQILPPAAT